MAISINSMNDGGLQQLASMRAQQLNLPLSDKSAMGEYLKGQSDSLFKSAALKQLYDNQANEMAKAQLAAKTQYGVAYQKSLADLGLAQYNNDSKAVQEEANRQKDILIARTHAQAADNRTSIMDKNNLAHLGIEQQQLGINQQNANQGADKNVIDQQKVEQEAKIAQARLAIEATAKLDDKSKNIRGAGAGVLLQTQQNPELAKDPKALNDTLNKQMDLLQAQGAYTDKEAEMYKNAKLEDKQVLAQYMLGLTQAGQQLAAKKLESGSSNLSDATKSSLQAANNNAITQVQQFADMDKKYVDPSTGKLDPNLFKYGEALTAKIGEGVAKGPGFVSSLVDGASALTGGIIPNSKTLDERAVKYNSFATDITNNMITKMTGMTKRLSPKALEMIKQLAPNQEHDSPELGNVKYQALKTTLANAIELQQSLLANHVAPDKVEEQVANLIQTQANQSIDQLGLKKQEGSVSPTQVFKTSTGATHTGQEILDAVSKAQAKGDKLMTVEKAMKMIGAAAL